MNEQEFVDIATGGAQGSMPNSVEQVLDSVPGLKQQYRDILNQAKLTAGYAVKNVLGGAFKPSSALGAKSAPVQTPAAQMPAGGGKDDGLKALTRQLSGGGIEAMRPPMAQEAPELTRQAAAPAWTMATVRPLDGGTDATFFQYKGRNLSVPAGIDAGDRQAMDRATANIRGMVDMMDQIYEDMEG